MSLREKCAEADRLAGQLECSLAVQGLVPDAFANGKASVQWSSRYPYEGREAFTVTINGTRFPATDVPDCLWNNRQTNRRTN